MKNLLLSFAFVFCSAQAWAAPWKVTPSTLKGGKIVFAKAVTEDGQLLLSEEAIAEFALGYPNKNYQRYTPFAVELNVASCALSFSNYTDFELCFTSWGLKKKIQELDRELADYDTSEDAQIEDYYERRNWLQSFYDSLFKK